MRSDAVDGKNDFIFIRDDQVRQNLTVPEAIEVIRNTYRELGEGKVWLSEPSALTLSSGPGQKSAYKIKGAGIPGMNIAGFRMIGNTYKNEGKEEASTHTYCYLTDSETAVPLALVEEYYQHILRTGVCTAVSLSCLAKSDSQSLGIIGAGMIARTTVQAIAELFNITHIRVHSRTEKSRIKFADWIHQGLGIDAEAVSEPSEAVRNRDLVVTISSADQPIVRGEWISPGCTLCSAGGNQELDPNVLDNVDKLVVDDFEWCTMAGDIKAWIRRSPLTREAIETRVHAEIGEIIAGLKHGRENNEEKILAVIQGVAVCDIALSGYIYRKLINSREIQRLNL